LKDFREREFFTWESFMENLYSWLIIFCGATIALLGSFLFVSERELRNKRREVDEFKRKQTTKPVHSSTEEARSEAHAAMEITRNEELAREMALLSSRLEESERALNESQSEHRRLASVQSSNQQLQEQIGNLNKRLEMRETELSESTRQIQKVVDLTTTLKTEILGLKQQLVEREKAIETLQSGGRHWLEIKSENQKLRLDKQGLQEEIDRQRIQLNSSEARLQESVRRHQELSDRYARLEQEAIDFKQRLEDSQAKARQMETAQQQLADVESRETVYREQQQRLEALVVDLERDLSEGKNQIQALAETHEHLQETERVCQELSDENRRLGEEISQWQERFAASEQNQRQVTMLRRELEELQMDHARLLDEKRQAQVGIAAVTEEMSSEAAISKTKPLNNGSNETCDNPAQLSLDGPAAGIPVTKEEESSSVLWTSLKQKWRFGAVPVMVILVIAGAAAMGLLGTPFSTSKEVAVAPATTSDEYGAEPVERVSKPQRKPAPRLRGTFETVRAAQIYSGPSENSAMIASIGPGMKLNVVDSSNGWLEIRSKHGRPPGFIRQEATVKIGQN
jgi:chromosome segregation ATPase